MADTNKVSIEAGLSVQELIEQLDKFRSAAVATQRDLQQTIGKVKQQNDETAKALSLTLSKVDEQRKAIAALNTAIAQIKQTATSSFDPESLKTFLTTITELEQELSKINDSQLQSTVSVDGDNLEQTDEQLKEIKKDIDSISDTQVDVKAQFDQNLINAPAIFDKLRSSIKLTDQQYKTFLQNIISNAQHELVTAQDQQEIEQLTQLIKGAELGLKQMGEVEDKVTQQTGSMRSQLKELKNQLQQLEDQGKDNTAEFEHMAVKAGKLQDQIDDTNARIKALGSDTFVFDAIISGITGVAAGFAVTQGIIGLVGDENEDLQKALLKVNAAMSILQGLQTLQNVLQKQSAAAIAIDILLKRNQAAATGAVAVATEGQAVATEGAAVAQKGLNVAMLASPAGILLLAITAIVTALILFSGSADKAIEKQTELNKSFIEGEQRAQSFRQALIDQTDDAKLLKGLEDRIAAFKAEGKSQADIIALEQQAADTRKKLAEKNFLIWDEEKKAYVNRVDLFRTATKEGLDHLISLSTQLDDINAKIAEEDSKSKKEKLEKTRDLLKSEFDLEKQNTDRVLNEIEIYDKAVQDSHDKDLEAAKFFYEQSLKSARAFAEAQLIIARAGSAKELKAQIDVVNAKRREDLANVNLTAGERLKIERQAQKDIEKLRTDFEVNSLKSAQKASDAKALEAVKGSKEELDFRLQSLDLAYQADIQDKNKNINDLLLIDAKYLTDRGKLIKEFNQKQATDAVTTRVADLNAQLADAQVNTADRADQRVLELKKKLVDEQASLDQIAIENSELSEEQKRIRIKAVYDKALSDKKQLEKDKVAAEIDNGLSFSSALLTFEQNRAKQVLDNQKSSIKERKKAEEDYYKFTKGLIDADALANQQRFDAGLITFEDYLANKLALQTRYNELEISEEDKKGKAEKKVRDAFVQALGEFTSQLFALSIQRYDEQIKKIDEFIQKLDEQISAQQESVDKEKELAEKGFANDLQLSEARLAALKKQKDKELENEKKLQKQKAEIQKAQIAADSIAQVSNLVTAGSEIFKVSSQLGPPGVALAIAAIALMIGAFVASKVQALKAVDQQQSAAGFREGGTYDILKDQPSHEQKGVGLYNEKTGKKLAEFEGNEKLFIVNKGSAKKYERILNAINKDELKNWSLHEFEKEKHGKYKVSERLEKQTIEKQKDVTIDQTTYYKYKTIIDSINAGTLRDWSVDQFYHFKTGHHLPSVQPGPLSKMHISETGKIQPAAVVFNGKVVSAITEENLQAKLKQPKVENSYELLQQIMESNQELLDIERNKWNVTETSEHIIYQKGNYTRFVKKEKP